jgi:hypothetical protein
LLYVYPSLILPLSFIVLLVCIHLSVHEEKRIWSLIALSLGILYATMASINYNIQVVAVRQSLAAGETMGIEMFIPDNPHSVFNAMANSKMKKPASGSWPRLYARMMSPSASATGPF